MEEVSEMKEDQQDDYNKQLELYREQLEKWKHQKLAKVCGNGEEC